MKVFKFEVMILDFEGIGEEEISLLIDGNQFLHSTAMKSESRDIEWHDEHPLNKCGTMAKAYIDLFAQETKPKLNV